MELFAKWLLLASINLAATMSPGPAFAMTVRNAIAYDRRAALFTALGLGIGVGILVSLVLGGFAVILTQSAPLYNLVRYVGAAYLAYIGVKAFLAKKAPPPQTETDMSAPATKSLSDLKALRMGILTNISNPKGIIFFTAVYTQFIAPDTPWQILVLYATTAIVTETVWFSGVSLILTDSRIKSRFLGFSHWIERVCGGLLIALGVRLALSESLS